MTEPQEIHAGNVVASPNANVIQPQPTPQTFQISALDNGMVLLIISGHSGQHISFLPAESAIDIGNTFAQSGRQAKSGLIIPGAGVQMPSLNGGAQH